MFCRNCGKELSDKAVACTGCGMNPHDATAHCPACGTETKDKQVVCIACGVGLEVSNSDTWSTGAYIGWLALSFFIPLFGFVYGGIHFNKAAKDSKRKNQALHFIIAAGIGSLSYSDFSFNS